MLVMAVVGVIWSPSADFQQQPSISDHAVEANFGNVSSGSPRMATSHFNLRNVAAGVAELWGPMATFTALLSSAVNHCCGTRSSGGGQRQNKYDGAVGMIRKSGANLSSLCRTCCTVN